ncbi:MAG: Ig domain protein group 1 domain protein, partial [Geminicoccaceae bacterium]|nr:Ig domain protein group 1 domain protein [Geminicoccaceae bacterium]
MSRRGIAIHLLYIVLAGASLTCTGDDLGPAPEPATITMVRGNHQVAPLNQALPDSLVVQVRDAQGAPLGGVTVAWAAAGGGNIDRSSVVSGSDGFAAVQRVLGATPGEVTTTALVPGLPEVVFVSTADGGAQGQLTIVTQPSSEARSNVPLLQQPVIRLVGGAGEPAAAGTVVSASVEGAALGGTTALETDANGEVHFTDLVLSGQDGTYSITFSAADVLPVRSAEINLTSAPSAQTLVI